jgi:hypothetical protein
MLDEGHGPMAAQDAQDRNKYVLGQVHNHNVVIACLPAGVDGFASVRATRGSKKHDKHRIGARYLEHVLRR